MAFGRPGHGVPLRNRVVDQTDDRLGDPWFIEEFDHQGDILGKALTFVVRSRME
jgi:hypothetical protein